MIAKIDQQINFCALQKEMEALEQNIMQHEVDFKEAIEKVQPHYHESARNLVHYLSLRSQDRRELQNRLSYLALSSIAHSEGYTLSNVRNIKIWLQMINNEISPEDAFPLFNRKQNVKHSGEKIEQRNRTIFGDCNRQSGIRIMVTMPTEAADDPNFIKSLIDEGMNIARINCSHDSPEIWEKMIANLKAAERTTNKKCLVYMDLSGPKLRSENISEDVKKKDHFLYKKGKAKKGPSIILRVGDNMRVMKESIEGKPARIDKEGNILKPASISTTLPEIFADIKVGERICFDDGAITGVIEDIHSDHFDIKIIQAAPEGSRLGSDKGINLPDTHLNLPSLTDADLECLPFITEHADIVGYSFVRTPDDVKLLQRKLAEYKREDIGMVLKIETKEAFQNLSHLLLTAMQSPKVGIMIARGDLAVEVGFERIAEVQEELLWLCEAAHIPVIWATQVLEKLAKTGLATRAEITDAAMAERAECVMLNKGPFILQALTTLDNIIERMAMHQNKRHGRLRPLNVAKSFFMN